MIRYDVEYRWRFERIGQRFDKMELRRAEHQSGDCNGHCYFCFLEKLTLRQKLWRWLAI